MTRLLMVAAGTGGHVYPALAVAERLRTMGVDVAWLGTAAGIESRLVPAAGFPLHVSGTAGLRGKGAGRWIAAPLLLLRSCLRSLAVLVRVRPHVVLGMGGYGAGPGGLVAWLLRIPLVIHEQNAVPGLTNRIQMTALPRWIESREQAAFPERLEARPFAFNENRLHAERIRDHQDVGEQDRAIEFKTANGLETRLHDTIGVVAEVEEGIGGFPQRPIFGKIATGLSHQPQRHRLARFATQCREERLGRVVHGLQLSLTMAI